MKNKTCDESLDLARRIRATGIRIAIEEDDRKTTDVPSGVLIRPTGGEVESMVVDFYGGTAFIIHTSITINLPRFAISAFRLELPWKCAVRWLEDPLEIGGTSKVYRFDGGNYLPDFERENVLNHCADVRRILPRGSSVEGCLLGLGDQCVPDAFRHGMMIPGFLIVFDQFSREYRSPISLWADGSQKLRSSNRRQTGRKGLFDCPDPGYGHALLEDNNTTVSTYVVK